MATRPVKIGVGMRDKRARILRSLDARLRYLAMVDTLTPWTPPARQERPPRPPDPDPYRMRPASHFYTPRERPALAYPSPGPEALSDAEVAPYRRAGRQEATARALAFMETFAPRVKAAP